MQAPANQASPTNQAAPTAQATPAAQAIEFGILSPQPDEAVRGLLAIQGTTAIEGFVKAEVAFSYAETPDTWFLLSESSTPVENGTLAQWDTGTITDGNYALRLLVTLQDGSQQSMTVEGVRVRNYSPVETLMPTPTSQGTPLRPTPTVTTTPTRTPVPPTPTPLPPNPAGLSSGEVLTMLGKGALFVLGTFAGLGIYQRARRLLRRDR